MRESRPITRLSPASESQGQEQRETLSPLRGGEPSTRAGEGVIAKVALGTVARDGHAEGQEDMALPRQTRGHPAARYLSLGTGVGGVGPRDA